MGIFDRAKGAISSKLGGEEVVKKGNFASGEEPPAKLFGKKKRNNDVIEDFDPNSIDEYVDNADLAEPVEAPVNPSGMPADAESLLANMRIPVTFTIKQGILFPDSELANKGFSQQAPVGYDMGEVNHFLEQVRESIMEYVKLLKSRNADVRKLAEQNLKLVKDYSILRDQVNSANGINIMTGSGDDDALKVDLQDAQRRVYELEQENDRLRAGLDGKADYVDNDTQNIIVELRNDLSLKDEEIRILREKNNELTTAVNYIEEEHGIQVFNSYGDVGQISVMNDGESFEETPMNNIDYELSQNQSQIEVDGEKFNPFDVANLPDLEEEEMGLPDEGFSLPDFNEPMPDFSQSEESAPDLDDYNSGSALAYDPDEEYSYENSFGDSAFTEDQYQDIDEFMESNVENYIDTDEDFEQQNDKQLDFLKTEEQYSMIDDEEKIEKWGQG